MNWRTVTRVMDGGAGRIMVAFKECDHVRTVKIGDLVQTAAKNPSTLIGNGYFCLACNPGEEVNGG